MHCTVIGDFSCHEDFRATSEPPAGPPKRIVNLSRLLSGHDRQGARGMVLLLSPGLAAVRSQLSTLASGGLCLLGLLLTVGLYVGAFRGGESGRQ